MSADLQGLAEAEPSESRAWGPFGSELLLTVSRPGVRASLERGLRRAIRAGRLHPGTRLPSTRMLAADLNVARNTVASAYERLTAEGWLTARRGSGTRVAPRAMLPERHAEPPRAPQPPAAPAYELRPGLPNLGAFPRSAWLSASRTALHNAPNDTLGYADPQGRPELREALVSYLGRVRAVHARPDRVVICAGRVHAFSMICAELRRRGASTIALEAYGDPRLADTALAQGLMTVLIDVDEHGARVEQLHTHAADAVLLTPSHQFPTGHVLRPDRRTSVVQWARRTGALIIEDDYDGEFRHDRQPVAALQELAPEAVAYLGSASKSLAPGLRLAWAVLPGDYVQDLADAVRSTIQHVGSIEQITLAEFLQSGRFDQHLRRSRLAYRQRRDRLVAVRDAHAPDVTISAISAGLHAVLTLPSRAGRPRLEFELVTEAARRGVSLNGLSDFRLAPQAPPAAPSIVVGYGAAPDHAFEPALRILFETLARASEAAATNRAAAVD